MFAAMALPLEVDREYALYFALALAGVLVLFCRPKLKLWLRGILFLVRSSEKKGMSKAPDAAHLSPVLKTKTIIFIRHGESEWNEIFNKNKLLLLPRLVMGLIREALIFTVPDDSVFIDSGLSKTGINQAKKLQEMIKNQPDVADDKDASRALASLRGDRGADSSVLVSSNHRRAMSTGSIALWPRLKRTNEKIIVLSALQEMSRNVDTNALADKGALPSMPEFKVALPNIKAGQVLDPRQSLGNKSLKSTALPRMEDFCAWCFERKESVIIVSSGHSLYFKNFFKVFMPKNAQHHAKEKKMVNCGVVSFKLEMGQHPNSGRAMNFRVQAE